MMYIKTVRRDPVTVAFEIRDSTRGNPSVASLLTESHYTRPLFNFQTLVYTYRGVLSFIRLTYRLSTSSTSKTVQKTFYSRKLSFFDRSLTLRKNRKTIQNFIISRIWDFRNQLSKTTVTKKTYELNVSTVVSVKTNTCRELFLVFYTN